MIFFNNYFSVGYIVVYFKFLIVFINVVWLCLVYFVNFVRVDEMGIWLVSVV